MKSLLLKRRREEEDRKIFFLNENLFNNVKQIMKNYITIPRIVNLFSFVIILLQSRGETLIRMRNKNNFSNLDPPKASNLSSQINKK